METTHGHAATVEGNVTGSVGRHEALVPMGCMVSSKGRHRNCRGFGPDWIEAADGPLVYDQEGRAFLDWSAGLGALTLGHRSRTTNTPQCYPLPHRAELELAERLHQWIPCAEQVRMLKTGTDATSAAIRLARVVTGKDRVVDAGSYHGCADWSISDSHEGVPTCVRTLTKRVPFNDLEAIEDELLKQDVAAVIMEPVSLTSPYDWYLPRVRELCTRAGVVLIFDEVITGIRMGRGGAQMAYGVTPDLCCIGKALANGHPISAVCGKQAVMSAWSRTHLSGTHFGEPTAMEASLQTLDELVRRNFWRHQAEIGGTMLASTAALIVARGLTGVATAQGHAHWWMVRFPDTLHQTLWQQECIRRGVLASNGSHFVTLAHGHSEVRQTLAVYDEAFRVLKAAIDAGDVAQRLECVPNIETFKRSA